MKSPIPFRFSGRLPCALLLQLAILSCVAGSLAPLAAEPEIRSFVGPSFHAGGATIDRLEFLSEDVVQFHSDPGNLVWDLAAGRAIAESPPGPAAKIVRDYELATDEALVLDGEGRMYIRKSDTGSERPIGRASGGYRLARFCLGGTRAMACGTDTVTSHDFLEAIDAASGQVLWTRTSEHYATFILLPGQARAVHFDPGPAAFTFESLALIDADGSVLATRDLSGLDFWNTFYPTFWNDDSLYRPSANSALLVNAAAGTILELDGSLGAVSPDSTRLIAQPTFGAPSMVDAVTGAVKYTIDLPSVAPSLNGTAFAFGDDGEQFYLRHEPGKIQVRNVATGALLRTIEHGNVSFNGLAAHGDILFATNSATPFDPALVVAIHLPSGFPLFTRIIPSGAALAGGGGFVQVEHARVGPFHYSPDFTRFAHSDGRRTEFFRASDNVSTGTAPEGHGSIRAARYISSWASYLFVYKSGYVEERAVGTFEPIASTRISNLVFAENLAIDPATGHVYFSAGRVGYVADARAGEIVWSKTGIDYQVPETGLGKGGTRIIQHPSFDGRSGIFDTTLGDWILDFSDIDADKSGGEALSADGNLYARAPSADGVPGSGGLRAYSVDTGALIYQSELTFRSLGKIALSADGSLAVILARDIDDADQSGPVSAMVFDLDAKTLAKTVELPHALNRVLHGLELSANGRDLYYLTDFGALGHVDLETGETAAPFIPRPLRQPFLSSDDDSVAACAPGEGLLYVDNEGRLSAWATRGRTPIPLAIRMGSDGRFSVSFEGEAGSLYELETSGFLAGWQFDRRIAPTLSGTVAIELEPPIDKIFARAFALEE